MHLKLFLFYYYLKITYIVFYLWLCVAFRLENNVRTHWFTQANVKLHKQIAFTVLRDREGSPLEFCWEFMHEFIGVHKPTYQLVGVDH